MLAWERLIEAVRLNPELYDTQNPSYMKAKLKTRIWTDIAKELNLKDGEEAKNMWMKLRGGFRDARRRHRKCIKSGASPQHIKPWKYQRQMSFLEPFMFSGPREGNLVDGSDDESQLPSEPLKNTHLESHELVFAYSESECSSQLDPGGNSVILDEGNTGFEQLLINGEGHDDDGSRRGAELATTTTSQTPMIPKKRRKKPNVFRDILNQSIKQREERARQRAEERENLLKESKNTDDPLFNFFMSMYQSTKTLPQHYQHRIRSQLFQSVSDAEAEAMNINCNRPPSTTSYESSEPTIATHSPYTVINKSLHTSSKNTLNTQHIEQIHHAHQMERDNLAYFITNYQCDSDVLE